MSFMARMTISFLKMVMKSRKSSTHCLHTQTREFDKQAHLQPIREQRFPKMEVSRQQGAPAGTNARPLTAGTDVDPGHEGGGETGGRCSDRPQRHITMEMARTVSTHQRLDGDRRRGLGPPNSPHVVFVPVLGFLDDELSVKQDEAAHDEQPQVDVGLEGPGGPDRRRKWSRGQRGRATLLLLFSRAWTLP